MSRWYRYLNFGYDGTGLLVDYLETTNFDDTVVNNGSVGMIVNVAKNYDATDFDLLQVQTFQLKLMYLM